MIAYCRGVEVVEPEPRLIPQTFPGRCKRTPQGIAFPKVAGDNGFHIKISGNPEKYVPGELYTDEVNVNGLYGDFYINPILTAHGVYREHQTRLLATSLRFCGQETGSVLHVIKRCEIWTSYRSNWPNGQQSMSLKDMIKNADIRVSLR
ncbi:hypothetical protein AVEN_233236-1 [Araneus ventricosus]|uniref:Uncharacterized protein n=1 Tax=Araneus ventricosus TaxID=182803 RepID=A0A4Y2EMK9_ARAVE|nr:hypothetical protein AVEN_233236-1 [Araneus ventricosus]